MATKNTNGQKEKITALYCRLSQDDGISGTTFERPDFKRMQEMIENGEVSTVIVKAYLDLVETIYKSVNILKSSILRLVFALSLYKKM